MDFYGLVIGGISLFAKFFRRLFGKDVARRASLDGQAA
jgi:hypothetical protein